MKITSESDKSDKTDKTDKLESAQVYYKNGQIWCEACWLEGKLHNSNGPAIKTWYANGQIERELYWLNDIELTKEEWEKQKGE